MGASKLRFGGLGVAVLTVVACSTSTPAPEAASSRAQAAPPEAPAGGATTATTSPPEAPRVQFPSLVTKDLNGVTQRVPEGLPGEVKLFLIAYQRDQQDEIDPWLTLALRLEGAHPGFRVYELPTLSASWGAASTFIDDGMRRGIRDPRARARTLTLYLDKPRFNQALALTDEDRVHALLVDGAGDVVWSGAGPLDDASGAALTDEVQRRLGG
jgi:hypothetical protein